jgi:SMC interacting uncharacterized protein involved in chromosome segregation
MSEEKELDNLDPFGEEAEVADENLITDGMVKKATYLIHKLAEMKGQDFKEIQKKCKKLFGYVNLAKVTLEEGHKIIDKLIELTGGEEEKPSEGARVTDDRTEHKEIKEKTTEREVNTEIEKLEYEIRDLAIMLQICVSNSRGIVSEELGKENITEGTKAILIKSFAATLFIEASRRGLGR